MKYCRLIVMLAVYILLIGCTDTSKPDANVWLDPWMSCTKTPNPKSAYGDSHWIQYDLGSVRTLSKSWVWNTNDKNYLDRGFKEVKIDHSKDGNKWNYHGEMTFPQAGGDAIYAGFPGPDLSGVEARYVLLTAISNYGDSDCAGLTEVKFNLMPAEVAILPDSLIEDDDHPCDETTGIVFLRDGEKVELSDFEPHHSYQGLYQVETKNGWVDVPFKNIDKVYIRHVEGNHFMYDVRMKDGESLQGFSNVFRNFVDGETPEGNQVIEYTDIEYFTISCG
ncbi:MAG: discoidin domain-containing protein [Aurantibacter sp.]